MSVNSCPAYRLLSLALTCSKQRLIMLRQVDVILHRIILLAIIVN